MSKSQEWFGFIFLLLIVAMVYTGGISKDNFVSLAIADLWAFMIGKVATVGLQYIPLKVDERVSLEVDKRMQGIQEKLSQDRSK